MDGRSTGEVIRDLCFQQQDIGVRLVSIYRTLEEGKVSEAKRKLRDLAVALGFAVLVCEFQQQKETRDARDEQT